MSCPDLGDDFECDDQGGGFCESGVPQPISDQSLSQVDSSFPEPEYRFIVIVDDSAPESDLGSGTGGVDICSVVAECRGAPVALTVANFSSGDGTSADHNDPSAAVNVEAECNPDNHEHYVSLGLNGVLSLEADVALVRGCTVRVEEYVGSTFESYTIEVCTDPAGNECSDSAVDLVEGGSGVLSL